MRYPNRVAGARSVASSMASTAEACRALRARGRPPQEPVAHRREAHEREDRDQLRLGRREERHQLLTDERAGRRRFHLREPEREPDRVQDERVRGEADADAEDRDHDRRGRQRVPPDGRGDPAGPTRPERAGSSNGHAVNLRVPASPIARPGPDGSSAGRQSEPEQHQRDHRQVVAAGHHRQGAARQDYDHLEDAPAPP